MSVENVENHMAHTCKCGSVNFALLKSGAIECNKCSDVMSEAKWLSAQPVEEHSLSLSYQIRRAIKAEDALHVAKQEIANLNELLNAAYVEKTAQQAQPDLRPVDHWFAEWELVIPEDARKAFQEMTRQAQPERNKCQAIAYSQFLTDVTTAAGLLKHGKQCKHLAERIADYAFTARAVKAHIKQGGQQ